MDDEAFEVDRHDSMVAVATAPIKGASAGGSGVLSLWSYHRPFMPLSVLEGHQVGAVTDFFWLETPQSSISQSTPSSVQSANPAFNDTRRGRKGIDDTDHRSYGALGKPSNEVEKPKLETYESDEREQPNDIVSIWQHVLSVGRDGRCLIQSFVRGTLVEVTDISPGGCMRACLSSNIFSCRRSANIESSAFLFCHGK